MIVSSERQRKIFWFGLRPSGLRTQVPDCATAGAAGERLRLEIVEHLRLTQAAVGSAKAVSASVASFGTVAEDFGKSRAAA
jgi:hypothetical protein